MKKLFNELMRMNDEFITYPEETINTPYNKELRMIQIDRGLCDADVVIYDIFHKDNSFIIKHFI